MSSFNGDWTGTETPAFETGFQTPPAGTQMLPSAIALGTQMPPSATAAVVIESDASSTLLHTPITNIASANSALTLPYYVICDPVVFAAGIKFTDKYLKKVFPTASMCIRDAMILAKQRLITHGTQDDLFMAACKDYVIEMVTVAKHSGRPVELGRRKQE
jgi:hypothetical protein